MTYLVIDRLDKTFAKAHGSGAAVHVVNDLSMAVNEGEIVALLGASGSGKTTLLRCIGGLETPESGAIRLAERTLFSSGEGVNEPPHRRNMGMVFQSYALWPHMNVSQNVGYPLVRRRMAAADIEKRVREYLALVDCAALAERFPHQLSGGQQQRVALARALVAEPSLVLFDEPLSNLDANLREQLRFQIRELKRRVGFTGVYVTHDHAEAIFIADRIAIIRDGCLMQLAPAGELYDAPASREVADFLGFTNTLGGRVESGGAGTGDDVARLRTIAGSLSVFMQRIHKASAINGEIVMKCHPSRTRLAGPGADGLRGRIVDRVRAAADSVQYVVELEGGATWHCTGALSDQRSIGDSVVLTAAPEQIHVF